MVRTYKKKSNQHSWDEGDMKEAIAAVREGKMGFQKAADTFDVPLATLYRKAKKVGDISVVAKKTLGRYRSVFTEQQENELVEHCLFMEKRLFGLKPLELRRLAFEFATRNNISHPFKDGLAGKDWYQGFVKRNPQLSLRVPEHTSVARAGAFNKQNISQFFSLLTDLQDKHNFRPSRIFNVDETGISTVPNKPSKIIGHKGKKRVGILSSAERGTTTTAVICCNAAGQYIPPLMIFPRARENPELLYGTPPETVLVCHPSGWMQSEIFCPLWFDHFLKFAKPSESDPVLLILDGHATHTKNIALLEAAREHSVHILCIPPHTSHRLQPLDVTFMLPLSTFYTQETETWLRQNPGRVITIRQVGLLFGKAYRRAAIPRNAENGFKNTGICPLDVNIFLDDDFEAAVTTDRPQQQENQIISNDENAARSQSPQPNYMNEPSTSRATGARSQSPQPNDLNEPSTSRATGARSQSPQPNDLNEPSTSRTATLLDAVTPERAGKEISKYVSPSDIMPLPQTQATNKRKSVRGKTAVLTSSPYFKALKDTSLQAKATQSKSTKRKLFNNQEARSNSVKIVKLSQKHDAGENADCLFCGELFSTSKPGEEWVRCSTCLKWAHMNCTSFDSEVETDYICDFCVRNVK